MNERDTTHFDSEDDYSTGCRNVSQCHIQDYVNPDDHTQPTHKMTPGFKLFTISVMFVLVQISMQMLSGIDFQLRVT